MKRKGSSGEQTDVNSTKRRRREKKSESESAMRKSEKAARRALEDLETQLDLSCPKAIAASLLSPYTLKVFKDEYWEKKPLHVKRSAIDFYGNIVTREGLMKLIEECTLNYEIDLNAWKCVEDGKESLNGDNVVKVQEVKRLLEKANATIQFSQPQRFSVSLWKIMEQLEIYFGSVVGANVVITPKGAKSLPLQSNDMEDFILQLEGKQTWSLYKATEELSRELNPSLHKDEIGDKLLDVNLEPGDLLYYPRGTIFEAVASNDGYSTHLSFSTYHNNSWGDFLLEGMTTCIESAMSNEVELRKGLPFDYLQKLGTCKFLDEYVDYGEEEPNGQDPETENNKKSKKPKIEKSKKEVSADVLEKFKTKLKDLLCLAVSHFDPNTVTDSRSEEFMANRLPPFNTLAEEDIGDEPTAKSSIKLLYPDHLRLVVYDNDDDDEFDADAAEETDEEDIVGDDDEMEEDEEDDEDDEDDDDEEEKQEKSKSKKVKTAKGENGKGKQKEKRKEKKKTKGNGSEDEDMEDEIIEEDEEDSFQGPHMRLLFSVHNQREAHMVGDLLEPNAVKLELHFAKPVKYLLDHCREFISLKDLPLEEESDKLELAKTLWTEKLVCVK